LWGTRKRLAVLISGIVENSLSKNLSCREKRIAKWNLPTTSMRRVKLNLVRGRGIGLFSVGFQRSRVGEAPSK